MTFTVLIAVIVILYALASVLSIRSLTKPAETLLHRQHRMLLLALTSSLLFHGVLLRLQIFTDHGLDLSFGNAMSLVMWVITLLYLITGLFHRATNIGAVILPLDIVTLIIVMFLPANTLITSGSPLLHLHIAIAVLAYSLLALAGIQALFVNSQEKALRKHQARQINTQLPPLEAMESLLFLLLWGGFILLSLTLVSGIFFSEQIFGKAFVINHHIVLSASAWLVFGIFLFGHWRWGWRGRNAVHWTIGGLSLLVLGYFGTKFVLEFMLGR
jgi:ABC-type uncharacterized transport system permease subunit